MFTKPFSLEGRIRRTEYGVSLILYVVAATVIKVTVRDNRDSILAFAYIPLLLFIVAQGVKRCHDVGNNGWWQFIPFYAFWLLFEDGQEGANEYGNNPKDDEIGDEQSVENGHSRDTQESYKDGDN